MLLLFCLISGLLFLCFHKGYGLTMNIFDFTADQLYHNIRLIAIDDESFRIRVRRASEILRSAPRTPVQTAAYWIDHVARYGGDHLRSGGQDLPLHAYLMLDVLAAAIAVLALGIWIVMKIAKIVSRRLFGRPGMGRQVDKMKTN